MPYWVSVLDAADGDPLRAQEIEANLTLDWWQRWHIYHREQVRVSEEKNKE